MCRDAGVNHFDTAHAYTNGQSEQILGLCVSQERDDIFVATKVGYTGGAAPDNLDKQFDISRQRLDMDVIDLLYLHRFDPETPLETTLEWFQNQIALGRIRYVGLSNFAAWQIVQAQFLISEMGGRIDAVQPMYNLVKRQAEVEILPACRAFDIATFTYSPLGAGLLSGKYTQGFAADGRLATDTRYAKRYGLASMHETAQNITEIARDFQIHSATLAIAWVLRSAFKPSPIISARTTVQLRPCLDAIDLELPQDVWDHIAAVVPTPPPATDRLEEA
jgi:aryl-alcohol dehydrogenase-like predicted oxidoreductase